MTPPRLAERFLRWIVRDDHSREMVTADLRLDHQRMTRRLSRVGAYLWYWCAVAGTAWWYTRERWGGGRPSGGKGRVFGMVAREARLFPRTLRRAPAFTAVTIGTVGLAVAASTAVFAVLDGVILKSLSYPNERELVRITHRSTYSGERLGVTNAHYFQYGERAASLADIALYQESSAPADGVDGPTEVGIITATPSLFAVLDVQPFLGRLFTPEDARPGNPDLAILSYGFWMNRFGGDSSVIGKPLSARAPIPIVGILPPSFDFIRPRPTFGTSVGEPDIYVPMTLVRSEARFGNFAYQAVARLAPGATVEQATRELTELLEPMPEAFPGGLSRRMFEEGQYRAVVEPLKTALVGDVAGVLWIVTGSVVLVLVIATVNLLNLFLVRAEGRRAEIAVRRALGASLGRVASAFTTEAALLCAVGGGLGVVLAAGAVPWLQQLAPDDIPRLDRVVVDHRVLLVAAGVTVLSGLVLGLVPFARWVRTDAVSLGTDRSVTASRARHRVRQGLVVGQVALALVLLIGAGLLVRTFLNLRHVDPGFGASDVVTVRITLGGNFPGPQDRTNYLMDLTRRMAAVPGVQGATFAGDLPLDDNVYHAQFAKADALPEPGTLPPTAARGFVGPGYFRVIGATLLQGRELTRADYETDPDGVVVNRTFAERWWPGEDVIGKRTVQWPAKPDTWYRVIGVVADIREASLSEAPEPTVYLPTVFRPRSTYGMFIRNYALVVKTFGDPVRVLDAVRDEIDGTGDLVPVTAVQTLDGLQAASMQQLSFAMILLVIAGGASLVLGVVGIYGVVTYVVSRRTREIGVRIALGARPADIRGMVLRQAAVVGGIGVTIGVLGATFLSRALATMLFGVAGTDVMTYGAVSVGLLGVVMIASMVPARRAAAVDPVTSLRAE